MTTKMSVDGPRMYHIEKRGMCTVEEVQSESGIMMESHKNVVAWDSQTTITELEPVHGRTGYRRC